MKPVKRFTRKPSMEPKVFVGSLVVDITCYLKGRRAAGMSTAERGLLAWGKKSLELVQALFPIFLVMVIMGCGKDQPPQKIHIDCSAPTSGCNPLNRR